ncbi:hypothetical protein BJ166DRAFT_544764 [Pestalotiopsis sp. NC0098]|nr:hypothetical protein BJ166DRAFT_544764 [Pestalotiopsis sp. NC0098]
MRRQCLGQLGRHVSFVRLDNRPIVQFLLRVRRPGDELLDIVDDGQDGEPVARAELLAVAARDRVRPADVAGRVRLAAGVLAGPSATDDKVARCGGVFLAIVDAELPDADSVLHDALAFEVANGPDWVG